MNSQKVYFLFNSATAFQSEALNYNELVALLTDQNLNDWFFWQEGMGDWEPCNTNTFITSVFEKKNRVTPPPTPQKQSEAEVEPESKPESRTEAETLPIATNMDTTPLPQLEVVERVVLPKLEVEEETASPSPTSAVNSVHQSVVAVDSPVTPSLVDNDSSAHQGFENEAVAALPEVEAVDNPVLPKNEAGANTNLYPLEEKERRKHERINVKYRAVITNSIKAFMTTTNNVSLGGMMVNDEIPPEIFNQECEVFLFNEKTHSGVCFKCIPVADSSNLQKRFIFNEAKNDGKKTLNSWLELQKNPEQNKNKKAG